MEKKEYKAPEVTVYGDVKEITKAGGPPSSNMDAVYPAADPPYATFDPLS